MLSQNISKMMVNEAPSSPQVMDDFPCAQKLFNKPARNTSEEITASRNNYVLKRGK